MSLDKDVAEQIAKQPAFAEANAAYQNASAPGAAGLLDMNYRQAFEVFRQAHEYRKSAPFMGQFREWLRKQQEEMNSLLSGLGL